LFAVSGGGGLEQEKKGCFKRNPPQKEKKNIDKEHRWSHDTKRICSAKGRSRAKERGKKKRNAKPRIRKVTVARNPY